MNEQTDLDTLPRCVQDSLDRRAIEHCAHRHARGPERFDVYLLVGTSDPDGLDEHGTSVIPGPTYGVWFNAIHAAASRLCLYDMTTHNCEIGGAKAHAKRKRLSVDVL